MGSTMLPKRTKQTSEATNGDSAGGETERTTTQKEIAQLSKNANEPKEKRGRKKKAVAASASTTAAFEPAPTKPARAKGRDKKVDQLRRTAESVVKEGNRSDDKSELIDLKREETAVNESPAKKNCEMLSLDDKFDRMAARECLFGALSKMLKADGCISRTKARLNGALINQLTMDGYELVVDCSSISESLESVSSHRNNDLTYQIHFEISSSAAMNKPECEVLQLIGKFLNTLKASYFVTLGHADLGGTCSQPKWTSLNEVDTSKLTEQEQRCLSSVRILAESCSSFERVEYALDSGSPNTTSIWFAFSLNLPGGSEVRVAFGERTQENRLSVRLFVEELIDHCFTNERNQKIAKSRFYHVVNLRFGLNHSRLFLENSNKVKRALSRRSGEEAIKKELAKVEISIKNSTHRIQQLEKDLEKLLDC